VVDEDGQSGENAQKVQKNGCRLRHKAWLAHSQMDG
jgi:hypothetical protein